MQYSLREALDKKAKMDLEIFLNQADNALTFPVYEKPEVSFLMLTYNKAEYTFRCLKSILAHADVPYEIIVVDNASSDSTRQLLERMSGITTVFNKENVHFLRGTNQAAQLAQSQYVYMFNNDTELTAGAISQLKRVFHERSDCGAVGSKLIWPTGELQEAGSIVFSDGGCQAYGREQDPFAPEFNYLREVDYCSGASLLIRRKDFESIGGLDTLFEPAYYEEVDLCMELRKRGLKTYYQPRSVIIHYEFSSSSKDWAVKTMQDNCRKFVSKWGETLQKNHLQRGRDKFELLAARDKKSKPNLLIIDDRVPCISEGQGYARAYSMLRILADDYRITFFAKQNPEIEPKSLDSLQQAGVEVVYNNSDFDSFLKNREKFYQIIMASRPHNFIQCLPTLKKYGEGAKLIYDAEALFFSRAFIQNKVLGVPSLDDCEKMRADELSVMTEADRIIVVSDNERNALIAELPHLANKVSVFGYALGEDPTNNAFDQRKDLLFLGAFVSEGSPNTDAVHYFVNKIFPIVREKLNCKLIIAGSRPTESILKLQSPEINVLGFVDDVKELYNNARVFVVPHRFAGGIPLKLVECMSYGLPAVVSELIGRQMNLSEDVALIAKNDAEFADKIVSLYLSSEKWHQCRQNEFVFLKRNFDPNVLHDQLKTFL